MTWRPLIPDAKTDDLPPLIFLCRWRHNPGSFCDVHVERSQGLCARHEVEERDHLARLREQREGAKA